MSNTARLISRVTSSRSRPSELWVAIGMFCLSTWWYLSRRRRQRKSLGDSSCNPEWKAYTEDVVQRYKLGSRAQAALTPPIPYLNYFQQCLQNECHAYSNPKGYIALCIAENKLVVDLLSERCQQRGTATATFEDASVYSYNSFHGMPVAQQAAAYFLARRFLFANDNVKNGIASTNLASLHQDQRLSSGGGLTPEQALEHIEPRRVALGSGAAALMNHLFCLLGEAGADACLIPAPYYAAFDNTTSLLAGITAVPIHQDNPIAGPTVHELHTTLEQTKAQGLRPRFLLITNPNNPLGTIYSSETVKRMIDWARSHEMHTIMDEVYALGTHKKHAFESVLSILDNKLGHDVHLIWSLSKDFGAGGLSCGMVYSQNDAVSQCLTSVSMFTSVSGPIQYLVSELLTDDVFCNDFLQESRRRVTASYKICISKLQEMVVPYVPAQAGLFVYVDLSAFLPQPTFEWEAKLVDLLFVHARIVLTPGSTLAESKPGMFRICYAWVSPTVLLIAMERLSRLVAKLRRLEWDDLNDYSLAGVVL